MTTLPTPVPPAKSDSGVSLSIRPRYSRDLQVDYKPQPDGMTAVIILGGAAMGDDAGLLKMVEDAMTAGAAGIAIGRNVWQHRNPALIARSLAGVVHQDMSALEALALMKEPLR